MQKRILADVDLTGEPVLLRVDFNLPIETEEMDAIQSYDHRIRVTLPTINYLLERDCKIILCSHLGRPGGKVVEKLRLSPIAEYLSRLLRRYVTALPESVGPEAEMAVSQMERGDVILLENLRFHPGEEQNDAGYAANLASLANIFVLDAFATAHRSHASIVGVPDHIPAVAGLLLQREIEVIGEALECPERPLAAVLGGAKVSDKIKILEALLGKVDAFFVGGGMAATFLKAQGKPTGVSRVEDELVGYASDLLCRAKERGVVFHLPDDVVVTSEIGSASAKVETLDVEHIPHGFKIVDIGPRTSRMFSDALSLCKTIIWNGPMGIFEYELFSRGTKFICESLASLDAVTIIGGGSTAEAVQSLGAAERMAHVSTGGGAMLEFLEGKELPGIAALWPKVGTRP